MLAQVAGVFGHAAVRSHGRGYLLGLLSQQERKSSWWQAELAGDVPPEGMQRLLNFSPWDEDAARDALARYVARRMGDPAAVLAVDETGFLKNGRDLIALTAACSTFPCAPPARPHSTTPTEVTAAQAAPETAVLAVVYGIILAGKPTRARGGTPPIVSPWWPDEDALTPIAYRYRVPFTS
jgi:DDE superfamily endonuclease